MKRDLPIASAARADAAAAALAVADMSPAETKTSLAAALAARIAWTAAPAHALVPLCCARSLTKIPVAAAAPAAAASTASGAANTADMFCRERGDRVYG